MALVAYSDESDLSDSENDEPLFSDKRIISANISISDKKLGETENCNNVTGISLCQRHDASIPGPTDVPTSTHSHSEFDIDRTISDNIDVNNTDILDDVPTMKTWHIQPATNISDAQNKPSGHELNSIKKERNSNTSKLKLVLPALSEFEDEDDVVEEVPVRKKLKPSGGGTGLFAVLPKPRGPASLVPLHVSRPPKKVKPQPIQQKKTPKRAHNKADSGDEDLSDSGGNDFFSLSDTQASNLPSLPSIPSPDLKTPTINVGPESTTSIVTPPILEPSLPLPLNEHATISEPGSFIPFELEQVDISSSTSCSNRIGDEALLRLAGRRNKGQMPNFIDIRADDALMSREEWVTRAICDEKPKKSFSKKKEGNPTQQQKRKHHITYLAHQAQEREQELQNSWGQNRFTKMQTQSKYGF